MRPGDTFSYVQPLADVEAAQAFDDLPGALKVTTQSTPNGAALNWMFYYDFTRLGVSFPPKGTVMIGLQLTLESESNQQANEAVTLFDFDVGRASLTVLHQYWILPYFHNADSTMAFHAYYAVTYSEVKRLVSGLLRVQVKQHSWPSEYRLAYDATLTVFGYQYAVRLTAAALEGQGCASLPEAVPFVPEVIPRIHNPPHDDEAQSNGWCML